MRENPEPGWCCCVIIDETGEEERCLAVTSGPDEPFCDRCETRHADDPRVLSGEERVTQRIPRKERA